MLLGLQLRCFVRKLKHVPRQDWVVKAPDAIPPFEERSLSHIRIDNYRDIKMNLNLGLPKNVTPTPLSPFLHPLLVKKPKILSKIYRWCACGMSRKQPFCDGSHKGTAFKPFKFILEEPILQIELCGCKLTSEQPFCDGKACKEKAAFQAAFQAKQSENPLIEANKKKDQNHQNK